MKIQSINAFNQYNSYIPVKKTVSSNNIGNTTFSGNNNTGKIATALNLPAKGINILFNKRVKDVEALQYSDNTPTVHDVYNKFQRQLNPVQPEEVEETIKCIESNGINREEALYAMQALTQFGNIKSLLQLGDSLKAMGINDFYNNQIMSCNLTFKYLYNCKFFTFLEGDKKAYILDENGLKYLETHPKKANKILNRDDILFINLEGWNNGINIYNQGKDDKFVVDNAVKLIARAKNKQANSNFDFKTAFNKSLNEDVLQRAEKIGIKDVKTISLNQKEPSVQSITENLAPLNIKEEYIEKVFNIMAETIFPKDKEKQQLAKQLITGYFYSESEIFSPKRLGENLKILHDLILEFAKSHKKSDGSPFKESDIVYLIPERGRSYEQIGLQYATVNNVPVSNFKDNRICESDKIYVVLDDVIGSGNNMLSKDFKYERLNVNPPYNVSNYHIVMADVTASQMGIDNINREIKKAGRVNQDVVIVPPKLIKPKLSDSEFYKNLSLDSKSMLLQIFNSVGAGVNDGLGYNRAGTAFLFPYMGPDNNTNITCFIFAKLVPHLFCLKSRYYIFDDKSEKIVKKIKEEAAKL